MQILNANQSFVTLMGVSYPDILRHFTSVYLALVSLAGVVLNSKALWKLAEVIKIHNTNQNFLLINLISSEFAISFCGIPVELYFNIVRGSGLESFLCPSVGFIHTFFGMNSLFSIMALANVRYLSVVRMQRQWHSEVKTSLWFSKYLWYLWGMAFMFAASPLVGFGHYRIDEPLVWCCAPHWSAYTPLGISYNWFLISLGFFLPTLVIIASNCSVMKIVRKKSLTQRRKTIREEMRRQMRRNSVTHATPVKNPLLSRELSSTKRSDSNSATIIGVMTASFYICYTPYAIRCILKMLGLSLTLLPSHLTVLMTKTGVIINPIIYIYNNKEITGPVIRTAISKRRESKAIVQPGQSHFSSIWKNMMRQISNGIKTDCITNDITNGIQTDYIRNDATSSSIQVTVNGLKPFRSETYGKIVPPDTFTNRSQLLQDHKKIETEVNLEKPPETETTLIREWTDTIGKVKTQRIEPNLLSIGSSLSNLSCSTCYLKAIYPHSSMTIDSKFQSKSLSNLKELSLSVKFNVNSSLSSPRENKMTHTVICNQLNQICHVNEKDDKTEDKTQGKAENIS